MAAISQRRMYASSRLRWVTTGGVVASYAVLTLLLFAPVLPHFATAIAVGGEIGQIDGWQNVWNFWWLDDALRHAQNPFFTRLLFFPTGAGLFWHTLNIFHGVLAWPITAAISPAAAFNAVAMISFVASGYAMFLLARRLGASPTGSWIGGALFAFSPFRVAKLYDAHLNFLCMHFLPLFVLGLIYAFEQRSRRWTGACAALLVAITLTDLYYSMFSMLYLGLYALVVVARNRQSVWRVAVSGLLVVLPALLLLGGGLLVSQGGGGLSDWEYRQILSSATPLGFALPSPNSPWWGAQWGQIEQRLQLAAHGTALGLSVFVLAAVGVLAYRRELWHWVVLIGLIFLFELGPYLVLNGHVTSIRLPYALIDLLPPARTGRRPNHFIVYRSVLLALLAARGWSWIAGRLVPRRQQLALLAAVALISVDLWPRAVYPWGPIDSPFYHQLATMPGGAVLELPPLPKQSDYLQAQMVHHHPLAGGYLSRTPPYPVSDSVEGLRQLWNADLSHESIVYADWTAALPDALGAYGIDYVVLHLDKVESASYVPLRGVLDRLLEPIYRDATMVAYRRPQVAPVPVVGLDDGWYQLERGHGERWQWTNGHATIGIMNGATTAQPVMIEFAIAAFDHPRTVVLDRQAGRQRLPVLTWTATPAAQHMCVLLDVAPGQTTLSFDSDTSVSQEATPRDLGLMFTQLAVGSLPGRGCSH